jgi:membrane-associated phospholipid phosphatase
VRAFEIATEAGDSKWILVPSLVLTVVFWRWKREVALRAFVVFAAVAGSGLSANLIKILVCRYRPTAYIDHGLSGFDPFAFVIDYSRNSFPSGHATTALSAAVALGLIAPRLRYFFWLAGGIVAFSRVVITAHYASDVIAGALIGGYWAMWMFRVIVKRNNIPTINS